MSVTMSKISLRAKSIFILTFFILNFVGCGSSGGATGGDSFGAPVGESNSPEAALSALSATVELRSVLARAVPTGVDTIRASGYDRDQIAFYGPVSKDKATTLTFSNVPLEVTDFVLEYLEDGRVVGIAQVGVQLSEDQTFLVENPEVLEVTAALEKLSLEPTELTFAKGTSTKVAAIATFRDGSSLDLTSSVIWNSSNFETISIDGGTARGENEGSAIISASFGGVSDQVTLTVSSATLALLTISPSSPAIAKGTNQDFTAEGLFTDGSLQDLTNDVIWTSSDTSVATVAGPTAEASSPGQSNIIATLGSITSSTVLTVTEAELTQLTISSDLDTIIDGTRAHLLATGTFSDNSTQDLTSSAVWTSSNIDIATIESAGVAVGEGTGLVNIVASYGKFEQNYELRVVDAVVEAVVVTTLSGETSSKVNVDSVVGLNAVATLSNGETLNVTDSVFWSSEDDDVAEVSNALGDQGQVTGLATGLTSVSATYTGSDGAVVGSIGVSVFPVDAPSLSISRTGLFDTQTGLFTPGTYDDIAKVFTPDISQTPAVLEGWEQDEHRLIVSSLQLSTGVTLVLDTTGGFGFRVKAEEQISIGGDLVGRGSDGDDSTRDGASGSEIALFCSGDVFVDGSIFCSGGEGANGPAYPASNRNAGRGGDGGRFSIVTEDEIFFNGNVEAFGGPGGLGGDGPGFPQASGVGGAGGNGGAIKFDGLGLSLSGTLSNDGGDGGDGGSGFQPGVGGDGGSGSNVILEGTVSGAGSISSCGGVGGSGKNGGNAVSGSVGGQGGDGGYVAFLGQVSGTIAINNFGAAGGNGGSGGNVRPGGMGGNGGDSGDVAVIGTTIGLGPIISVGGSGGNGGNGGNSRTGGTGGSGGHGGRALFYGPVSGVASVDNDGGNGGNGGNGGGASGSGGKGGDGGRGGDSEVSVGGAGGDGGNGGGARFSGGGQGGDGGPGGDGVSGGGVGGNGGSAGGGSPTGVAGAPGEAGRTL